MTADEIKRRILVNQHLAAGNQAEPGHDKFTVLHDLCGVQAQFMGNAYHALKIRCTEPLPADTWGDGLVKNWSIRATIHVFAGADLPLFLHTDRPDEYRRLDFPGDSCVTAERKQLFARFILKKIGEGICEREALKKACFIAGMTEVECRSVFDQWGGTIRNLAERGYICYKVQEKRALQLCQPFLPMKDEPAKLEIARRYFTYYGPATVKDAAYFLGTTQTAVKSWLSKLPVASVESEGRDYYFIENGKQYDVPLPDCILLAGFDPMLLGYYKQQNLFLPAEHLRGIFTLSGIVFPSILLHGRIVGKWKKEKRKLTVTLFENVSGAGRKAITDCAERMWSDPGKMVWC